MEEETDDRVEVSYTHAYYTNTFLSHTYTTIFKIVIVNKQSAVAHTSAALNKNHNKIINEKIQSIKIL